MAFSELIALYLFLGGTAAGVFAVLSVVDLRHAVVCALDGRAMRTPSGCEGPRGAFATQREVAKRGYAVAFCMVVVGLLCLLGDLGRPEAFYLIFLYPTGSFMTIGAFSLTLMTACLALSLAASALALGPFWERAALVAKAVGVVASVIVMVYTGMLLETVIAVKLWGSMWLPVLFLFSALSCGCAVVLLCACSCGGFPGVRRWVANLALADVVCIVLEAVSAIALVATVNAAGSGAPFDAVLFGDNAWLFWFGFVGCALAAPLAVEARMLLSRTPHTAALPAAAAAFVLAGGFCLRFALVLAGIQTAL